MRVIDYLVSFNNVPQVHQQVYAQQAIQTYREMQEINNAKNINLMRDQTVVDIYKTGTENQIFNHYKAQEKNLTNTTKNQPLKKETYEISFTNLRTKKNYNKGTTLDLVV